MEFRRPKRSNGQTGWTSNTVSKPTKTLTVTQVNFYALSSGEETSRLQFACRLCEKAAALGHKVLLIAESDAQLHQLDDLLWAFKPSSFIPHGSVEDNDSDNFPVLLCANDVPAHANDVLINLRREACEQHAQFKRINEILIEDQESLTAGRVAYRYYQSQGYQPETHKL